MSDRPPLGAHKIVRAANNRVPPPSHHPPYIWLLPNPPEADAPGIAKVRRLLTFQKRSRRAVGGQPRRLFLLSRLLGLMFRTMSDGKSLYLAKLGPTPPRTQACARSSSPSRPPPVPNSNFPSAPSNTWQRQKRCRRRWSAPCPLLRGDRVPGLSLGVSLVADGLALHHGLHPLA
ncbi:hypothetical protein LZ31DRAFT_240606 [Colletotrichum somersetense]|nr:hypothetical protein LZ31DRAFT_240606 [Colletotrichum somersetense]